MSYLAKLELMIQAAAKTGYFSDDYVFEYGPHDAAKLMTDRKRLLEAAEKACQRLPPTSPARILLAAAIEEAYAGWPLEPNEAKIPDSI